MTRCEGHLGAGGRVGGGGVGGGGGPLLVEVEVTGDGEVETLKPLHWRGLRWIKVNVTDTEVVSCFVVSDVLFVKGNTSLAVE